MTRVFPKNAYSYVSRTKKTLEGMPSRCLKTDIPRRLALCGFTTEVCIDIVSRILHLAMRCSLSAP